jgi:uncharacterized protein (DUF305 family)
MTAMFRRAICALSAAGLLATSLFMSPVAAQSSDATPVAAGCAGVAPAASSAGSGMMGHGDHGSMPATPDHGAGMMHGADFDLMYIDMMIPHHESIIALAEVAQHELTHSRLIEVTQAIEATQQGEIEHLRQLRDAWYPGAAPVSMDQMMTLPGVGSDMMVMEQQMSAEWQVQTFCAAEDKDLAFIEQVIPHHQMAIDTSEAAVAMANHPELIEIAQQVITAQQAEITELELIRAELTGQATPTA